MLHRKMIVKLTVLALLLALPVMAFAQTARVQGMALQGDYIKDYTGIYTYLSSLTTVGNLVYGELGNTTGAFPDDRGVGAVLGNLWDGRGGTWGIHLHSETPNLGQGDHVSGPGASDSLGLGNDPNHNNNDSFDLQWAKKFGGMSLGLKLNRAYRKYKEDFGGVTTNFSFDEVGTNNLGRNIMGYGAGVGFEMSQNASVEIGGLMETRTFENSLSTGAFTNDDGGTTYLVAGRMFWQWTPNTVVTPVVKVYSFDLSTKTSAPASFSNKLSGWQLGAAGNWTVGTSDLFVLGLTFASNTIDQEQNVLATPLPAGIAATSKITESLTPQIFAALETHVNRWLTLRFGANKGAFGVMKWENQGAAPQRTIEISNSGFNMNLGAGVKIGTLQLDGVLDNDFAQTFTQVTSTAAPIATKVTATYAF